MNTKQPEALRLADEIDDTPDFAVDPNMADEIAAELRRLHAENGTLRHKLQTLEELGDAGDDVQLLRMGYAAARLEIASLQAQLEAVGAGGVGPLIAAAQPMGAAPAKVLAGVIELAKAAHAHWDADRDAKVGKILMALAGWNEGYDWRADALHAAAAAPQPAAQALDAAFEAVRLLLCGLVRYSFVVDDDGVVRRVRDRVGNWIEFDAAHELFDPVAVDAAIAAQKGGANG